MLDLQPIKARLAAATPGPWSLGEHWPERGRRDVRSGLVWIATPRNWEGHKDADLIANAPTDLAALVAEVERLRGAIKQFGLDTDGAQHPRDFGAAYARLLGVLNA